LEILRECNGSAVSVNDFEIKESLSEIGRLEGMFIAPEGASLWAALKKLKTEGIVDESERVVLVNTGSGSKYAENVFN
jgi:threonine synthase